VTDSVAVSTPTVAQARSATAERHRLRPADRLSLFRQRQHVVDQVRHPVVDVV